MFVRRSTYEKAKGESLAWQAAYVDLSRKWTELVTKINAKGGQQFLDRGTITSIAPIPFSQEELKRLILLCHPDKHGGKEIAVEMTKKLNSLRDMS